MAAPHSSSALAVNVFDYWRKRSEVGQLAKALGYGRQFLELRFERRYATGFGSTPANIDVVLSDGQGKLVAIESKFAEPFAGGITGKPRTLPGAYVAKTDRARARWVKLPGCLKLSEGIVGGSETFARLDAPQLLKHALGLTRAAAEVVDFELVLLWYAPPQNPPYAEAQQMTNEIERFASRIAGDIRFRAITYQELFARLSKTATSHPAYIQYLRDRYF